MEKDLSFFNGAFWYSETNLDMLLNYPYRMEGGFILLCTEGEDPGNKSASSIYRIYHSGDSRNTPFP